MTTKNKITGIAALSAVVLVSACGTVKQVDANRWARDYYSQPNCADLITVEGTNVSWKIENATRIVFATPVPQKSIIPRDPTWQEGFFDTLKTVAPWLMMGWMVHDSGGLGQSSTTTTTTTGQ